MSDFKIPNSDILIKDAHIPNMLNKKESTAAAFAQGLADLFSSNGITRKEMKSLLEALQAAGALGPKISIPKIISGMGKQTDENINPNVISSMIAQISLQKFEENNQPLLNTKQSLAPPKVVEANKSGLFRTALMFYMITAGAKGPQLETRKPVVRNWFNSIIQSLLGNNPPSKTQREIDRLNKLKGWSTRENVFPPPFTDLEKKHAIQLLKEHLFKQGITLPDESLIAENAIAFYFNQSINLTYNDFEKLYQGIMSIRIKLESALLNPEQPVNFSPQEIKKLSTYMNVPAGDIENLLEDRKKDSTDENQKRRLSLILTHLIVLEYAHESLEIAYNESNSGILHPKLQEFNAFHEGVIKMGESVMDGNHPNIEHGINMKKPEAATAASSPSANE